MLVGGTAVFVGGTDVLVGGTAVFVGGTDVLVGGTAVFVGGTDVLVGGTAVFVGGTDVLVGGTAVFVGGNGVFVGGTAVGDEVAVGAGPAVQISTLQPSKLPPSRLALSLMVNVHVPLPDCVSKAVKELLGWYVPPPVGGQGQLPAAASSSRFRSKLSSELQERAIIWTLVPAGLWRLKSKSLIHVWLPFRFSALTSSIVPLPATLITEEILGVPLVEIVLGTSVLL